MKKYQVAVCDLVTLLEKMATLLRTKRHPDSDLRHGILIHSMLRAARTGNAQLLLSEKLYLEEMHCLNRSLAEISVNAVYLQFAPELETDNYLRHDAITAARRIQKINSSLPKEHRLDSTEEAHIRRLLAQPINETSGMPSWSSKTVGARAKDADRACGVDLMTTTALIVYGAAHPYVHGTASSVAPVGDWVLNGKDVTDSERIAGTLAALNGTALCLLSLVLFTGQRYQLGFDSDIEKIQQTLSDLGSN